MLEGAYKGVYKAGGPSVWLKGSESASPLYTLNTRVRGKPTLLGAGALVRGSAKAPLRGSPQRYRPRLCLKTRIRRRPRTRPKIKSVFFLNLPTYKYGSFFSPRLSSTPKHKIRFFPKSPRKVKSLYRRVGRTSGLKLKSRNSNGPDVPRASYNTVWPSLPNLAIQDHVIAQGTSASAPQWAHRLRPSPVSFLRRNGKWRGPRGLRLTPLGVRVGRLGQDQPVGELISKILHPRSLRASLRKLQGEHKTPKKAKLVPQTRYKPGLSKAWRLLRAQFCLSWGLQWRRQRRFTNFVTQLSGVTGLSFIRMCNSGAGSVVKSSGLVETKSLIAEAFFVNGREAPNPLFQVYKGDRITATRAPQKRGTRFQEWSRLYNVSPSPLWEVDGLSKSVTILEEPWNKGYKGYIPTPGSLIPFLTFRMYN